MDSNEDPWCIIEGYSDIKQNINFQVEFTLEVRSTSSLSYNIMLAMLPDLYRCYSGSEALRDSFLIMLIRALNTVESGTKRNGLYIWTASSMQTVSINYRSPPVISNNLSQCQIKLNKMLGPINLNIDFKCNLTVIEKTGSPINDFLAGPRKIKKRKIIEMGRLLNMDLVRIDHEWYI